MRGTTKGFTLRKGIVEDIPVPYLYSVRDTLNGNLITTSISGKLRMKNFDLEIGDTAYVVVGIYKMIRGRINIRYWKRNNPRK